MEITEEQRRRAEANRVAALAKRSQSHSANMGIWNLFKCRKILNSSLPESDSVQEKPLVVVPKSLGFTAMLEICESDGFSIFVQPVEGSKFPGESECYRIIEARLSNAIAIAACFMNEGPILVVCPAVLRFPWAEELESWLPFCAPKDIHLVFGHQDNVAYLTSCPKIVVISYTMLHRLRKNMQERDWAVMIIDESHNVRCTKKMIESDEVTIGHLISFIR